MKQSKLSHHVGLISKISRAYASQYVLGIILLISILLTLIFSLDSKISDVQSRVQMACGGLEIAATTVASTPHYAVASTNSAIQTTITSLVSNARKNVIMVIKLLNRLVIFLITRYKKLLVCILDSILSGTTGAINRYSDQIVSFLRNQLSSISDALNSGLDGINSQVRNINSAGSKIGGIFGGSGPSAPTFSLPEVSSKLNFEIPKDFQMSLSNLRIPDLEDARQALENIISRPFKQMEDQIVQKMAGLSFSGGIKFPVPAKVPQLQFCSNIPISWVQNLRDNLHKTFWIAIGILLLMMALIIGINAIWIWLGHKQNEQNISLLSDLLNQKNIFYKSDTFESLSARDFIKAGENPFFWSLTHSIYRKFSKVSESIRFRWFVDYTIYTPSLTFILIGILGIICVQIQYALIDSTRNSVLSSATKEFQESNLAIQTAIRAAVSAAVNPYIQEANSEILKIENELNSVLFGWADDMVSSINRTSQALTTGFNNAMSAVFEAVPPLKDAVSKFIDCLLGSAIEGFDEIATLLKDNKVQFPLINSNVSNIDSSAINDASALSRMISLKFTDSTTEKNQNGFIFETELDKLLNFYKGILRIQEYTFIIVTSFGCIGIFVGIVAVIVDIFRI